MSEQYCTIQEYKLRYSFNIDFKQTIVSAINFARVFSWHSSISSNEFTERPILTEWEVIIIY